MIDKKIYKTDYESEFTGFFNELDSAVLNDSAGVKSEVSTFKKINDLRDNADGLGGRNKIWEDF